jgi:myo-inositol-1(or 4)-monophosphatase
MSDLELSEQMTTAPEQTLNEELLDVAVTAALAAAEILLARYGGHMEISRKTTPTDLVSDADRAAEDAVLTLLSERRPRDGVLSEEGGREDSDSGIRWIVDPLDGTVNYLFRIPIWAVSIAAEDEKGTLVGVVHDPTHSETFTALRGEGARLNGKPITVSDADDLATAVIGTGFAYSAEARAVQAERMPRVLPHVGDVRRAGAASIDQSWVACGRLDGFFESPLNPWDRAAGVLLVEEAGGIVSELPAPLGDMDGVIAAGPSLHDALRTLILG